MAELTPRQHAVIEAGRNAMRETIREQYPGDLVPLYAVAITGAFSDICRASVNSGSAAALIAVINRELASAGLELVRKRRH